MADLLAQFDSVERAEQARRRRGDRDEAILGGGVDGSRDNLNPFDDQELHSPVAAMQVVFMSSRSCVLCGSYGVCERLPYSNEHSRCMTQLGA